MSVRPPAVALSLILLAGCSADREGSGTRPIVNEVAAQTLRDERLKMGTRFEIQLVVEDAEAGRAAIEAAYAEIDRVEDLLSEWRETSEISEVNRQAGRRAVVVGPDLFTVVERSIWAAEATGGAFDVTFAACGRLWSIRERRIPEEEAIAACLARVDYGRLELDPERSSIFVPDPDMRIGIAGIGKGYGVDRAAEVLAAHGFDRYIVDGGGDIRLSGTNVDRPWKVGIADPRRPERLFATAEPNGGAIVTSGDYQQFFEESGVRYHHILDTATGRPARRSVAVTVIAPTAMDADALATGLFVLGPKQGIAVAESLEGVEAMIFGPDLTAHRSGGFPAFRSAQDAPGP
jgi:thiamine biosynthesis lipoprotein